MQEPSETPQPPHVSLRNKIIGLGERSSSKSYYPELQRRLSELQRFRELLDRGNDAILLFDGQSYSLVDVGGAACRLSGYDRNTLQEMALEELLTPQGASQLKEIAKHQENMENGTTIITTLPRVSGSRIPVEITLQTASLNEGFFITAVARDIRERIRAEEERESLYNQLVQAQKMESIGRLAGGVAHDFNNMLNVILGCAELAMLKMPSAHPLYSDLKEIQRAAERSAELTRQLLAFARKQTINPKILDLNQTVESTLKMLRRLIGEDIELTWLPKASTPTVRIDPAQIDQILTNLCVNARDAIHNHGHVSIETETVFVSQNDATEHPDHLPGRYVVLIVRDNGQGMPPHIQEKIFEPFFTTKELGKGTGLGLATVYGIVRQNEGFIDVQSEPEKGTVIRIHIPLYTEIKSDPQKTEPVIAPDKSGETILFVEDEQAILRMGTVMLKHLGYQVFPTNSPIEALHIAQKHVGNINLIVTDMVMPQMNGRDLVREIHTFCPSLKSLFISGYTPEEYLHREETETAMEFIQKPFSLKELAIKIRTILDTH